MTMIYERYSKTLPKPIKVQFKKVVKFLQQKTISLDRKIIGITQILSQKMLGTSGPRWMYVFTFLELLKRHDIEDLSPELRNKAEEFKISNNRKNYPSFYSFNEDLSEEVLKQRLSEMDDF